MSDTQKRQLQMHRGPGIALDAILGPNDILQMYGLTHWTHILQVYRLTHWIHLCPSVAAMTSQYTFPLPFPVPHTRIYGQEMQVSV